MTMTHDSPGAGAAPAPAEAASCPGALAQARGTGEPHHGQQHLETIICTCVLTIVEERDINIIDRGSDFIDTGF